MTSTTDKPLAGQVALVTGAARRIGKATALVLAQDGAHVIVHAKSSRSEIDAVVDDIRRAGGSATAVLADITLEAEAQGLVDRILEHHRRLDILVNNAALREETSFVEIELATWRKINAVIVEGAFLVTRAAVPSMVQHRHGRIISIGGASAHSGVFHRVHVATSKAALVGFTKALAVEFGQDGITANLVVPGRIGGPRSATSGSGGIFPGGSQPVVAQEGEPRHVAEVVRMLASPTSEFMTGQTLHVSGGMYMP